MTADPGVSVQTLTVRLSVSGTGFTYTRATVIFEIDGGTRWYCPGIPQTTSGPTDTRVKTINDSALSPFGIRHAETVTITAEILI